MSTDLGVKARRDAAEVREEIERAREQLASSVGALRREVAMRTDWREWIRRHPYRCLAGALAVGFLIGRRFG